jgi:hypothetical protein
LIEDADESEYCAECYGFIPMVEGTGSRRIVATTEQRTIDINRKCSQASAKTNMGERGKCHEEHHTHAKPQKHQA